MWIRGQEIDRLLALLVEDSDRGARLRNGIGVGLAGLVLLAGVLAAAGEGVAAVALIASAALAAALAGVRLWRRRPLLRSRALAEEAPTLEQSWPLRPEAEVPVAQTPVDRRLSWRASMTRARIASVRIAVRPLQPRLDAARTRLARLPVRVQQTIGRAALDAGVTGKPARDQELFADRLARDRSALGIELRRVGEPAQAAEQHRTARALYAAAHNRRGEALAANSLALALADTGDEEAALEEFERARALLHAIGDEEHEAKVLANIGVLKQRVGALEEATRTLESALTKLSPETPAYRLVERQLRKAS